MNEEASFENFLADSSFLIFCMLLDLVLGVLDVNFDPCFDLANLEYLAVLRESLLEVPTVEETRTDEESKEQSE